MNKHKRIKGNQNTPATSSSQVANEQYILSVMKQIFNEVSSETDYSYHQLASAAPYTMGRQMGYTDPNQLITVWDTQGSSAYQWGLYGQMRYSHPTIASILDNRVSDIASLDYDVVPRHENPTISQSLAAQAVKHLLSTMPGNSLSSFVSKVYDNVFTYGMGLYELWIPQEGEYKNRLHLINIPANQILSFLSDEDRLTLRGAEINAGSAVRTLPEYKVAWFGEEVYPGNFWGVSGLRKVLAPFQAQTADIKNYLALRRLAQGILYFKETEAGNNVDTYNVVKNFLGNYYAGRTSPLLLPNGLDIANLNASDPTLSSYNTMLEYFDTKIREALNSSLSNLGAQGSGSLALGKEISGHEKELFVNQVDSFLHILNGDHSTNTRLLQTLTKICGFDIGDAPKIVVLDNTSISIKDSAETLLTLIDKGLIDTSDISTDDKVKLLEELGYQGTQLRENAESSSLSSMAEKSTFSPSSYSLFKDIDDQLDLYPTKEMAENAKRGLELRASMPPSRRAGTAVGIARARDIMNGKRLSIDTWKRMLSYFQRHEVDKEAAGFYPEEEGYPSKGVQSWLMWSGDEGWEKAKRVVEAYEKLLAEDED